MNKYILFFVYVVLVLSTFVSAHELTHIALNDFRFNSVCFLNCKSMDSVGLLGSTFTPVGVYLSSPINPIAKNEDVTNFSGFVFASIVGGGFLFLTRN